MTAPTTAPDRVRLKAAIHPVLHELDVRIKRLEVGDCHCNLVAEVVLDAILPIVGELVDAALDGSSEIEWGARCIAPSHDHGQSGVYNVRTQRAAVEEFLNILDRRADYELVCRRKVTGAWERVD